MRNRVGLVAAVVLLFGAGVYLWNPSGSDLPRHVPVLAPPAVSRTAEIDLPRIANSFGTAAGLPKALSDETFWKVISEFSESGGYFMYENFLSNEKSYQDPIPELNRTVASGGVYLGVGPEQNFTYIAAIRPQVAFIIDIRRQNMLELLLYKALFAMSANRGEFVSLLFSRRLPRALDERASPQELFRAYGAVIPDREYFNTNLERIKAELRLSNEDATTIEYVYNVFFSIGPNLTYSSTSYNAPSGPTYADLMTMRDSNGRSWSYLASEDNFGFVKDMQRKNLIVPVVGDFAGPKTIRTIGLYLKDHHATVSAFYVSNVEMYILSSAQWKSFCANVAALPIDQSSVFIRFLIGPYARAKSNAQFGTIGRNISVIGPMIDVLTGIAKGYPPSYYDLIYASK